MCLSRLLVRVLSRLPELVFVGWSWFSSSNGVSLKFLLIWCNKSHSCHVQRKQGLYKQVTSSIDFKISICDFNVNYPSKIRFQRKGKSSNIKFKKPFRVQTVPMMPKYFRDIIKVWYSKNLLSSLSGSYIHRDCQFS